MAKEIIEVDCRKCKNLGNDECNLYGKDPNVAVEKCAHAGFKNYAVVDELEELETKTIKTLEEYLKDEMWRYAGPSLGKEECELFLKLLKEKEERPEGHWIIHVDDLFPEDSSQECSNCHKYQRLLDDENYCPCCGAKMIEINKEIE